MDTNRLAELTQPGYLANRRQNRALLTAGAVIATTAVAACGIMTATDDSGETVPVGITADMPAQEMPGMPCMQESIQNGVIGPKSTDQQITDAASVCIGTLIDGATPDAQEVEILAGVFLDS